METLSFTDKRFQIATSYIGEVLKEKCFTKNNDTSYTKNEATLTINKMPSTNDLMLLLNVVDCIGKILESSIVIVSLEDSIKTSLTSIDETLKKLEKYFV